MRQRVANAEITDARMMDTEELKTYTGLGRNSAMNLGISIGARVKVGRRVLWDRRKVDEYFNSLTGVE